MVCWGVLVFFFPSENHEAVKVMSLWKPLFSEMASTALVWQSPEDEAIRWPQGKESVRPPPAPGFQPVPTRRSKEGVHYRSSPDWQRDEVLRICTINACSTANGSAIKTVVPVREGGLTSEQIESLAYNIKHSDAKVVCVQQLNLFSKEWEIVCAKLGDDWSSVAAHDGEMQMSCGAMSGLAIFSRCPIKSVELIELFDSKVGMEDVHRRAAMCCEVVLAQDATVNLVNVCFDEVFERFRTSQLQQLRSKIRMQLPSFEKNGYILVGALNGLRRDDYSDGAWDGIKYERRRQKDVGGICEQPCGDFMENLLRGDAGYTDCREAAGYKNLFEDGAMVESTGRHMLRTDYILLSPGLQWAPPAQGYDVLPPPQHTQFCHHLVIAELRRRQGAEKGGANLRGVAPSGGRRAEEVPLGFGTVTASTVRSGGFVPGRSATTTRRW